MTAVTATPALHDAKRRLACAELNYHRLRVQDIRTRIEQRRHSEQASGRRYTAVERASDDVDLARAELAVVQAELALTELYETVRKESV